MHRLIELNQTTALFAIVLLLIGLAVIKYYDEENFVVPDAQAHH